LRNFFGPNQILLQHKILIGTYLLVPSFFMVCLLAENKKYQLNKTTILLSSLKLSLIKFYNIYRCALYQFVLYLSFITVIIDMHAEYMNNNKSYSALLST
jgi:hypothetical protein